MSSRLTMAIVTVIGGGVLAIACSGAITDDVYVGDVTPPGLLGSPDAGASAEAEAGLISYCPSNKCPAGWTTCPSSRFPCDVNLWTDVTNCGACGVTCPQGRANTEVFSCVEGACVLNCQRGFDCDGLLDNGCETPGHLDDNCGACGRKCSDPAKSCVAQDRNLERYDCGCPPGQVSCGFCQVLSNNDDNCGACLNACDPTGGGAPVLPNTYYGCIDGKCGALKCKRNYADCDGDESTGCETFVVSDANCGGCGNACPSGQVCRLDQSEQPTCMCPEGLTYCEYGCFDGICAGECVDVTGDPENCGACGARCVELGGSRSACNYGTCTMVCRQGRADCNNSQSDGCEVNTNSDPRNCGECGHVCDAVAGQACVGGRCVVEPCDDQTTGGATQ